MHVREAGEVLQWGIMGVFLGQTRDQLLQMLRLLEVTDHSKYTLTISV